MKKWISWNWFKKGVLTVTLPRRALPKTDVKQIEVKNAKYLSEAIDQNRIEARLEDGAST